MQNIASLSPLCVCFCANNINYGCIATPGRLYQFSVTTQLNQQLGQHLGFFYHAQHKKHSSIHPTNATAIQCDMLCCVTCLLSS